MILAPGVMINACGLLLLGIGNKFSSVLNRIRVLNDEKRHLLLRAAEPDYSTSENQRFESICGSSMVCSSVRNGYEMRFLVILSA